MEKILKHKVNREDFWANIQIVGECWIWLAATRNGYGVFKGRYAHHISYEISHGEIPLKFQVLHHCDIPPCIRPTHLWAGTQKQNILDMFSKGRQTKLRAIGENNGSAKLTNEQVKSILTEYEPGSRKTGQVALARKYQVSQYVVWSIVNKKKWKHIDPAMREYFGNKAKELQT